MAQLPGRKRSQLPDSAFAYVDSRGHRRLPINDAPHVRNALARFNQVVFEDETARERARSRLLRAAARHGIVPIGFVSGQLRAAGPRSLPSGQVTFLMTDIEDSTGLLHRLGDGYSALLADVRRLLRLATRRHGGREIDARADEFFAVFKHATDGVQAAIRIQRAIRDHAWPGGAAVAIRIGIHSGRPTLTDAGYVGLAVHAVARVSAAAYGGQMLLSGAVLRALDGPPAPEIRLVELGVYRLHGLPDPEALWQVTVADLPVEFPPLRAVPAAPNLPARGRD